MFSLALVSFAFGALFSVFSSSFPLLRNQQETIAASLCLPERIAFLRSLSWPELTMPDRLHRELTATGLRSAATLTGFEEEVTVSIYPAPAPPLPSGTPLRLRRQSNGVVVPSWQPFDPNLLASSQVRVDLQHTWQVGSQRRTRATSAILAYGGLVK